MASASEQGMARILGSFEKLIAAVTIMGPQYNPSNGALTVDALTTQHLAAQQAYKAVNDALAPYTISVDQREVAFSALRALPARVRNAARALRLDPEALTDLDTLIRQLQGRRRTGTTPRTTGAASTQDGTPAAGTEEDRLNSVAQLSYDHKVANLHGLVTLLGNLPMYTPNEPELQVPVLQGLVSDLEAKNTLVIRHTAALRAARMPRFDAFYAPGTGLVDTGNTVKAYVKSVFGIHSAQWDSIRSLAFRGRTR